MAQLAAGNIGRVASLPAQSWRNLRLCSNLAGWLGLFLLGFCAAQVGDWGDFSEISRLIPPALCALLGLTFELRQPRPDFD